MNKIGFCYEDYEEVTPKQEVGFAQGTPPPAPPDLNNDLVDTINNLAESIARYGGQIAGLTIDADYRGNYEAKIKYNSGRR